MAKSVNNVFLMGRLTQDVELRSTSGGKKVTEISLAVDKGNDEAAFFNVVAWEKTAELLSQYTGKGSKVLVQGRLDQQTWEKDGKKNSKVVVIANDVTFLDSKSESTQAGRGRDVLPDDKALDKPVDLSDIPF